MSYDITNLYKQLQTIELALSNLKDEITYAIINTRNDLGTLGGGSGTPVPLPTSPVYQFDDKNLLIDPAPTYNGMLRIDPVVGEDCPHTVKVKSGHVFSKPRPDLGEKFMAYVARVSAQAGGSTSGIGSLFLGASSYFNKFGGYKVDGTNWPEAADSYFYPRVYMTPEEIAREEKAKQDWADAAERLKTENEKLRPRERNINNLPPEVTVDVPIE